MNTRTTLLGLVALLSVSLARADGALDADFGIDGRSEVAFDIVGSVKTDRATSSFRQPDGKLIVAGATKNAAGYFDYAVTRLLADGTIDTAFGPNGQVTIHFALYGTSHNNVATGVALQGDGKIVVVGTADGSIVSELGGDSTLAKARLTPTGALDTTFGGDGTLLLDSSETSAGMALAILPGGGIVVAGNASQAPILAISNSEGANEYVIRDLAPPGSIGTATAVGVDAGGRIVVAGFYSLADVTLGYDCFVARYAYSVGLGVFVLDPTFGSGGRFGFDVGGGSDYCWAMAIQRDGKIVLVGESDDAARTTDATIARVLADGSALDQSFAGSGRVVTYFEEPGAINAAHGVKLQSDGKIVVSGYGTVVDPARAPYDFGVIRLDKNGFFDGTLVGSTPGSNTATVMIGFEPYYGAAQGETDNGIAVSLDDADRIYVVGSAQYQNEDYDFAVARLESEKIFVSNFDRLPQ